MAAPAQVSVRNRLLATLSSADFSLLEPHLEPIPLLVRTHLVEPNTPIERVYFLIEGITSNVVAGPQGRRIEVGIIGREGLSGSPILLGADRVPDECFVQVAGTALQMGADDLRRAVAASPSLQQHLLRFVQVFCQLVERGREKLRMSPCQAPIPAALRHASNASARKSR